MTSRACTAADRDSSPDLRGAKLGPLPKFDHHPFYAFVFEQFQLAYEKVRRWSARASVLWPHCTRVRAGR